MVVKKPNQFGKYFLFDRVSTGGMAEIFRAKTVSLEGTERIVAVKKMIDLLTADKELTSMFIDEAKLAVQLNHPGICQGGRLGQSRRQLLHRDGVRPGARPQAAVSAL
jgi:hypothetical protein